MCRGAGWVGYTGPEYKETGRHQAGSQPAVTGVHHRLLQPHGAQSPGESLLLQEGMSHFKLFGQ